MRVLASGRASAIPVHALPWSADPYDPDDKREALAHYIPVVYGLDLPPAPERPPKGPDTRDALILVDSRAERAREEADTVASALRHWGWSIDELTTRDLPPVKLRHTLQRVKHFHYAGHAYYDETIGGTPIQSNVNNDRLRRWPPYSGGAAAEPSYIPLGQHGRLTVPDVLMMEDVPHTVTLMGCATGVNDERMTYGGFSLATAFLAAGARAVVASTDKIDGQAAAILGNALYLSHDSEISTDPGQWMTTAIRFVRSRREPSMDLTNYRVYVP